MGKTRQNRAKSRDGAPRKRSPLWLRDLMNLLVGLAFGVAGAWIVQAYLDGREARAVSTRFAQDVELAQSALKPFVERGLAVSEGRFDGPDMLEGLDVARPVHALDRYRDSMADLPILHKRGLASILQFYENLYKAELYRKLLLEQRDHPDQMSAILVREFMRTLQEGSLLTSRLLAELQAREKK